MAKRITIIDIARRAGVSSQTVSRVLNNKPDVADETRRRIESVIAELEYRPNELARGLRSQNTRTIGLIVPDNANPFFAEIAKGVENAGFEAGYSVILCNSAQMPERELEYVNVLQAKGVDGIIFISTTTHIHHIRPIVERGIPVVMFFREAGDLDVDTFKIDNGLAGYLSTQHLIELGHRDIACIMPRSDELPSGRRVDGFRRAMAEAGLPVNERLVVRGNNLLSGGEAAVAELLRTGEPFSAIFAANDAMAIGAMRALRESGLRAPEDVSVTGVDGILLGEYVDPPLTTVE
ncbi:MAG: LacI family DNA-binding transcriptional regulator, partial [Anaerolineae bacterium]|nr:LacI family DNA-binding transcriptional regulator [Anaerolineae bacterium]